MLGDNLPAGQVKVALVLTGLRKPVLWCNLTMVDKTEEVILLAAAMTMIVLTSQLLTGSRGASESCDAPDECARQPI